MGFFCIDCVGVFIVVVSINGYYNIVVIGNVMVGFSNCWFGFGCCLRFICGWIVCYFVGKVF